MRQLTAVILAACFFMLQTSTPAQGLFESAGKDSAASGPAAAQALPFSLSGHVKAIVAGGQDNDNEAIISAANARVSLRLNAEKSLGRAFSEIRMNAGRFRDLSSASCDVREAWASVSPGLLDIRIGRQIISWGRADAVNPTNNITPRDQTAISSEFDDTRLGNELLQVKAKIGPSGVQGIWIPCYRPDVLPIAGAKILMIFV